MIPILQKEVTKVNVVVGSGRTIDLNSTKDTVPSLNIEMRMIPPRSILNSPPLISEGIIWSNRTLR